MLQPILNTLLSAALALAQAQAPSGTPETPADPAIHNPWDFWPFGPGYGEHWPLVLARLGFIVGILALICLFLRLLFGPKGPLREKWIDEDAAEETARELEDLEKRYAAGEVDDYIYEKEKKRLTR